MRRSLAAALAALALAAGPAARAGERIEILDFGVYDHTVTQVLPEPKDVSGQRSLVANIRLREKTAEIAAQPGRMFGFRFRIKDPALIGRTLTIRKLIPRLTNPETGRSATSIVGTVVAVGGDHVHLNAYGFDYDWEMAEGIWTFQVILDGKILAEKRFKVIVPLN